MTPITAGQGKSLFMAMELSKKNWAVLQEYVPFVEAFSEHAFLYERMGDIHHALGQGEKAGNHWRRALELDPGHSCVRAKLFEIDGSSERN